MDNNEKNWRLCHKDYVLDRKGLIKFIDGLSDEQKEKYDVANTPDNRAVPLKVTCPCCGESEWLAVFKGDLTKFTETPTDVKRCFPYLTYDEQVLIDSGLCGECRPSYYTDRLSYYPQAGDIVLITERSGAPDIFWGHYAVVGTSNLSEGGSVSVVVIGVEGHTNLSRVCKCLAYGVELIVPWRKPYFYSTREWKRLDEYGEIVSDLDKTCQAVVTTIPKGGTYFDTIGHRRSNVRVIASLNPRVPLQTLYTYPDNSDKLLDSLPMSQPSNVYSYVFRGEGAIPDIVDTRCPRKKLLWDFTGGSTFVLRFYQNGGDGNKCENLNGSRLVVGHRRFVTVPNGGYEVINAPVYVVAHPINNLVDYTGHANHTVLTNDQIVVPPHFIKNVGYNERERTRVVEEVEGGWSVRYQSESTGHEVTLFWSESKDVAEGYRKRILRTND